MGLIKYLKKLLKITKMKKIAIVGHYTGANSFGITKAYMHFFSYFGEVSLISPFEREIRDIDLLVLPGGPDVNPERYLEPGEDYHPATGQPCMQRERFDRVLLPKYIAARIPIFSICRGHQSLWVQFGGKLIQHMYHESNGEDRGKEVHKLSFDNLDIIPGLTEVVAKVLRENKKEGYKVNSIHHQANDENFKPETATVIARYLGSKEATVEAATYWPHYPAHSVQWHPEEIWDDMSITLINHLLTLSDEEEV